MAGELTAAQYRRAADWGRGPIERAAANLPATTQAAIYAVSGGLVAVKLIGEVTTAIQNIACNLKVVGNPTVGTDVDLCANANVQNKELGTLLGLSGLNTDALIVLNAGGLPGPTRWVICAPGTIDLVTSASPTGQAKWRAYYVPLDDNATLVAA